MKRNPSATAILCLCVVLASSPCRFALSEGSGEANERAEALWREDLYFRESLVAIRDWERVLATEDDALPEGKEAPSFPVPSDGAWVAWPNPIPRLLRQPAEEAIEVSLRLAGDRVEVRRVGSSSVPTDSKVPLEEAVRGYEHAGGGGSDSWYHSYHRRFDRLTSFRPRQAPFALGIDFPSDAGLGSQTLAVTLRNATTESLELHLEASLISPSERRTMGSLRKSLSPAETASWELPIELARSGGSVIVVEVACGSETFRVPLFTHVEDVARAIEGIEKILADTPDPNAARELLLLRRHAERVLEHAGSGAAPDTTSTRSAWRAVFESASRLRDTLLLARVPAVPLLFVKRRPYDSEQPFMDAHHLRNPPGGGIYRLSAPGVEGIVEPIVEGLGEGIYRDLCLHWDARKFLFAFGNGSDHWDGSPSYHIYEADIDGSNVRQLTEGPKNDCEPFYLPGGQIGFTSDRSEHFVMCGGDRHAPTLFVMEADGSGVRQLSFNMFNDFNPTVLPDGRILYSRWEYNERSVTSLHNPFTMNPDGTMVSPFYGNATARPNVVMFPRPIPGKNTILALFTAHHGQTHGAIGIIDIGRGFDGDVPLTILTPGVPVTAEKAEDSAVGWYSDPVPISETTYLASYTPTVVPWRARSWALYVGDRHGNLALVHRDSRISCAEPVPILTRPRPHVTPSAPASTDSADATATLVILDVNVGLTGVPPGTARHIRILEDVPRKGLLDGGVILTSGTSIYTVKRILGTVPIEEDGSAAFVVPANRNVYFEVLDGERREIQRMRSVVCLKPEEKRSCVGCHEYRATSPPNRPVLAVRREPSVPEPPPWGTKTLSYLRDIQPIVNARCVSCHAHDREQNGVILTDDLTDQFSIGYEELLPWISVANAMRWDHPDDVLPRPPYTYGSRVSPLMKLLDAGHYGVELSPLERESLAIWIDANGVYYDRYEMRPGRDRKIFGGSTAEEMDRVHARRCRSCHGKDEGQGGTWWRTLNWRDVRSSRALLAPLSRAAGGWERCGTPVFADRQDPDFLLLEKTLTALREDLETTPREDLASVRGSAAETQVVSIPVPAPHTQEAKEDLGNGWRALGDLEWTSARAGWSPNGDGLPRRDTTIDGAGLRAGGRRFARGLGTHAPSQIVFALEGKYSRFAATIHAGEAGGTVVFRVLGDGKLLYESGTLRGPRDSKDIEVAVDGIRELLLVVGDAGDGFASDVASWAGPRLERAKD